jgi:asparagine synthase (glutamine-hydrolysing)
MWAGRVWNAASRAPAGLRRSVGRGLRRIPPAGWDALYAGIEPILPAGLRQRTPGYKIHKLADLLGAGSPEEIYHRLVSHWVKPELVVHGSREPLTSITKGSAPPLSRFAEHMMYLDLITYLPDDILTKVDRASMAVSLEARVPLLDHRVVEFAWALPLSFKIRDGQSKWILRQVLDRYVPRKLIERPKAGFGVPLGSWLRGPLREWAEEFLDEKRLRVEGFFDPAPIRRMWGEHLSGARGWEYELWDVLMFQAWLEAHHDPAPLSTTGPMVSACAG